VFEILEHHRNPAAKPHQARSFPIRIFVILVTLGLALAFRDLFSYFVSFIGALGGSALLYILPCTFDLKLRGASRGGGWRRATNYFLILFGVCGAALSIGVTVWTIVAEPHVPC
jgi:amino acid permease